MINKIHMKIYPKTIYTDLVGMPNPMNIGVTIHYFNDSGQNLYMKIKGNHANWTPGEVNLGLLNDGANAYRNLDAFMSRTKPSGELTEAVSFTLEGYSDAGYTILIAQYIRNVTVIFIKSDDGSWTEDELDNFDDGTVQGWSCFSEAGSICSIAVATDYVLSSPYSCKGRIGKIQLVGSWIEIRGGIQKTVTTPNKAQVYAIFNVRFDAECNPAVCLLSCGFKLKYARLLQDSTVLTHLGKSYDATGNEYIPRDKWLRIMVPLPKNITTTLKILFDTSHYCGSGYSSYEYMDIWLDDFKIISKN